MSYYNQGLTELPPLPNSLTSLSCFNNCLTRLVNEEKGEHLPDTLIRLYCDFNCLTRLPEHLPNSLIELDCYNNRLTKLPEHLPDTLTFIYCYNNRLTRLPERLPNSLTHLNCYNNRLISLPEHLPDTLKELIFSNNSLTKLPKSLPSSLIYLYCGNNPFLFNWKNNLRWNNQNVFLFNNYKVLVILQKSARGGTTSLKTPSEHPESSNPLGGVFQRKIQRKYNKRFTYFCRDINRLCNSF